MDAVILKTIPILQKYHIKKASLFGSYARNEQTAESDVDILVEPPDKMTLFGLAGIKLDLEKVLGKQVDVITYNSVHSLLKKYILPGQKMFYEER